MRKFILCPGSCWSGPATLGFQTPIFQPGLELVGDMLMPRNVGVYVSEEQFSSVVCPEKDYLLRENIGVGYPASGVDQEDVLVAARMPTSPHGEKNPKSRIQRT